MISATQDTASAAALISSLNAKSNAASGKEGSAAATASAMQALAGRKFADRTVVAAYYPEDKFSQGEY